VLRDKEDAKQLMDKAENADGSLNDARRRRNQRYYEKVAKCGVRIYSAPKGMWRERANKSRVGKKCGLPSSIYL